METVDYQVSDGAATILLNRPEVLNAWNRQFGEDLLEAVQAAAGDDAVRAVVIRGAGRGFSSGAARRDATGEVPPGGHPDARRALTERSPPIIEGTRLMENPVLAAAHGPA